MKYTGTIRLEIEADNKNDAIRQIIDTIDKGSVKYTSFVLEDIKKDEDNKRRI